MHGLLIKAVLPTAANYYPLIISQTILLLLLLVVLVLVLAVLI